MKKEVLDNKLVVLIAVVVAIIGFVFIFFPSGDLVGEAATISVVIYSVDSCIDSGDSITHIDSGSEVVEDKKQCNGRYLIEYTCDSASKYKKIVSRCKKGCNVDGYCNEDVDKIDITSNYFNINVIIDESACESIYASLECLGKTGCKSIKYGTHVDPSLCEPTLSYSGAIEFTKQGYLCYTATNNLGNKKDSTYLVNFDDSDGDGILNYCDYCYNSIEGVSVDENGCAPVQLTQSNLDSDNDGLPDVWEESYDSSSCMFNHLLHDSNEDGISDGSNDYDGDGKSNFIEFTQSTDPCNSGDSSNKEKLECQSFEKILPNDNGCQQEGYDTCISVTMGEHVIKNSADSFLTLPIPCDNSLTSEQKYQKYVNSKLDLLGMTKAGDSERLTTCCRIN